MEPLTESELAEIEATINDTTGGKNPNYIEGQEKVMQYKKEYGIRFFVGPDYYEEHEQTWI
jgi:hypothetical protein